MASRSPEGPGLNPSPIRRDRAGASGGPATFDEGGLRSLGDEVARANGASGSTGRSHHRKVSHHRKLWWTIGVIGAVFVVVIGGTVGYASYLNSRIHRFNVKGLVDVPTTGADAGTANILLVGSTDRCALKVQNAAYGLCSQGVNGVNSDVVMILHLNPNSKTLSILSVPRDLFVPNARTEGANKIDAALYQGPSQLVAAINENLGIPIQHYVVLNFDTFAKVVDALGGVKMYFPEPVFDAYSGLQVFASGCVNLDGLHALQVVRARHLQYKPVGLTTTNPATWPFEGQSDLARIRRDHEFLRVLASAVAKNGLSDPITDGQLISSVAPQLNVDKQFSTPDMVNMVLDFHGVNANSAPQLTLPVQVDQSGSYLYKGGYYGNIEFPSSVQDNQVIEQFLAINATTDTMTGLPLPDHSAVTVSVLNGSGVTNQATNTSTALAGLGFKMMGIGDSPPVAAHAETVVYFAHRTHASQAAAQAVAKSLSGAVITALGPTADGAQVTVVTGTQFSVNPPAASTPAATAATTTSPTSSSAVTSAGSAQSTGAFQAPTPAVTPLQPWDPRSCSSSGGPGK
jgi:LCP family protein required for cell wall assembly